MSIAPPPRPRNTTAGTTNFPPPPALNLEGHQRCSDTSRESSSDNESQDTKNKNSSNERERGTNDGSSNTGTDDGCSNAGTNDSRSNAGSNDGSSDAGTNEDDSSSESEIGEMLQSLRANRTILIVAHRAGALRHCDVVYEVDAGKIVNPHSHLQQVGHG